jgi:hypothetical protein
MSEPKKVKAERRKVKGLQPETEYPPATDHPAPTSLQTENRPPPTEDMEVHHHPNLHHEKKPWKEYLLEGLMIFLAVTMGFFAESLREHIGDTKRENDFAKALYNELRVDSATAAQKLQLRMEREKTLDYLYHYFKDSSVNNTSAHILSRLYQFVHCKYLYFRAKGRHTEPA